MAGCRPTRWHYGRPPLTATGSHPLRGPGRVLRAGALPSAGVCSVLIGQAPRAVYPVLPRTPLRSRKRRIVLCENDAPCSRWSMAASAASVEPSFASTGAMIGPW